MTSKREMLIFHCPFGQGTLKTARPIFVPWVQRDAHAAALFSRTAFSLLPSSSLGFGSHCICFNFSEFFSLLIHYLQPSHSLLSALPVSWLQPGRALPGTAMLPAAGTSAAEMLERGSAIREDKDSIQTKTLILTEIPNTGREICQTSP